MSTHHFVPTRWFNTLGTADPALHIASGDTIVTETLDAGGFDVNGDQPSHGPNPMNGPVHVASAEPGDALKVEILAMRPIRDTGWTRNVLAANVVDPEFVRSLPPAEKTTWHLDRNAGIARLENPPPALKNYEVAMEPMIGCFGVAPALGQATSTATGGPNGGNMDYRRCGPGTTIWFPVAAEGALFYAGDCHFAQGDGEIVGTGIETCFEITLRLTVEKARPMVWPRGETETDIFTLGNARPLDQALQHATTEMLKWLGEDFGLDTIAASHVLGQCVEYDIGNVFDPAYTVACRLPKRLLPKV